jgi:hypothetical protein
VTIVGVHTPETPGEANLSRVRRKVKENDIAYAIAVDGSRKTWRAYSNEYWPSIYLVDKKGHIRYRWDGELNWEKSDGDKIMRARIDELLNEK